MKLFEIWDSRIMKDLQGSIPDKYGRGSDFWKGTKHEAKPHQQKEHPDLATFEQDLRDYRSGETEGEFPYGWGDLLFDYFSQTDMPHHIASSSQVYDWIGDQIVNMSDQEFETFLQGAKNLLKIWIGDQSDETL